MPQKWAQKPAAGARVAVCYTGVRCRSKGRAKAVLSVRSSVPCVGAGQHCIHLRTGCRSGGICTGPAPPGVGLERIWRASAQRQGGLESNIWITRRPCIARGIDHSIDDGQPCWRPSGPARTGSNGGETQRRCLGAINVMRSAHFYVLGWQQVRNQALSGRIGACYLAVSLSGIAGRFRRWSYAAKIPPAAHYGVR